MKPKQLVIGVLMLLVAGLGIFGLTKLHGADSGGDPDDAPQEKVDPLITVQTGTLKRMTLHRYVSGYGTVEPAPATADEPAAGGALSAPAAGVVARVAVIAGQQVKAGDVLVELNSGTVSFAYAKAEVERQEKLFAAQNTSQKNLQDAEAQLASLQVISPVSGTVTRVSVRAGAAVDANAVVAEVIDLNRLAVSTPIPAADASDLKMNQEVQLLTNPTLTTSLSYVSPTVEAADGTVVTRALLPPNSGLRPGQFVNLRIVTESRMNCLAAPAESVVTTEDGKSVIALAKGDDATQVTVTAGLHEDGWVEIDGKDLKEGDTVVTVGAYGFPKEAKIRMQNSPDNDDPSSTNSVSTNSASEK